MMKMLQNITDIKAMTSEKEAWAKARLGKSSFAETEVVEDQGRHHAKSEAQRYANFTKKMEHNQTLELDGRDLASGFEVSPENYYPQASLLEVDKKVDEKTKAGAQKTLDEMDQIDAMMANMNAVAQKRLQQAGLAEPAGSSLVETGEEKKVD